MSRKLLLIVCTVLLLGLPLVGSGAARAADPAVTVTAPTNDSTQVGPGVHLRGTASADTGVARVLVGVRDRTSLQWLRPDGTWGPTLVQLPAVLADVTPTTASWSLRVELPAGAYGASVSVVDGAGSALPAAQRPWVRFSVTDAPPPTVDVPPLLQAQWPFVNQVFTETGGALEFKGTAQDDRGVGALRVSVQRRSDGLWLRPDGTYRAGPHLFAAVVDQPGRPLTRWRFTARVGAAGAYMAVITPVDTAGQESPKYVGFDYRPGAVANGRSYATLLMSRAQWADAQACVALPGTKTLRDVADALRRRGLSATTSIVQGRQADTERTCNSGFQLNSSWADLAALRDTYGWSFAVHFKNQGGLPLQERSYDEQVAATCGAQQDLTARGYPRSWGLFAFDSNIVDPVIQADPISRCFSYGRRYDSGVNTRAEMIAPWFLKVGSINGGYCNDAAAPCFDVDVTEDRQRYQTPNELSQRLRSFDDRWTILQLYRFVDGSRLTGAGTHWDCTDPDPRRHWTSRTEVYCWKDYLTAVDSIGDGVTVTDPVTVAEAWGRGTPGA